MADLIEVRRRIMSQPRKIRVTWNQMVPPIKDGEWQPYNQNYTALTIADGIATSTWLRGGMGYNATSRPSKSDPIYSFTKGDVAYLSYELNANRAASWSAEIGGGLGNTIPVFCQENVWGRVSLRNSETKTDVYRPLFPNLRTSSVGTVGLIAQFRNPIFINLTTMYGAGNEPSLAEFERQCALNGIDLTQYQPQDSGTVRSWYI